jgi:hypothetical protein
MYMVKYFTHETFIDKDIHPIGKRILERSVVTHTRGYKIPSINLAQKYELGLQPSIFF